MKPYYEHQGITIYHGDCREILSTLEKVDLVLTDPPYGIGELMKGGTWGSEQKYQDMRKWDFLPDQQTLDLIIQKGTNSIVWGGNYFHFQPSRCWLVWDKQNAVPTMADAELAWTNFDKPVKRISLPAGNHTYGHPTQKPLRLFLWSMSHCQFETVLDPFMGSGTTLRAAKDLNRQAIGIEIEEKYCEIAAKRLSQEVFSFK